MDNRTIGRFLVKIFYLLVALGICFFLHISKETLDFRLWWLILVFTVAYTIYVATWDPYD